MLQRTFAENDAAIEADKESDRRIQKLREQIEQKRRAAGEVIYKRRDVQPIVQQQQQLSSTEVDQKIVAALQRFKSDLTKAVGGALGALRQEWQEEIRKSLAEFQPQLPSIEGWQPRHYLKGSVVVSGGGTYQARQDTAHPPGHHSWVCLAALGEMGQDGRDGRNADGIRRGEIVDLPDWKKRANG
jgi:hypothetical protein